MKALDTFSVVGKSCVIRHDRESGRKNPSFSLHLADGTWVADDSDATWLAKSAHASRAKEVSWTGEAWAAWEALGR